MANAPRRNLYSEVTQTIVEALKAGVAPWVRPWSGPNGSGAHRNGLTGRGYNGVNVMLLNVAAMAKGFRSPEWFTFNQAKKAGGSVRKGERATLVVFWKVFRKEEENDRGEKVTRSIPLLRHYHVFNRDQIDGLPQVERVDAPAVERASYPKAEAILETSGAQVTHGGDRACYSPAFDMIAMPAADRFVDAGAYWSTMLHELGHWTGHESRLGRDFSGRFGSEAYAMEELVAELASAYLCEAAEIDGTLQHPEYIGNWIRVLENDDRAIFSAASQAGKAADLLLGDVSAEEEEPSEAAA